MGRSGQGVAVGYQLLFGCAKQRCRNCDRPEHLAIRANDGGADGMHAQIDLFALIGIALLARLGELGV